MGSRRRRKQTAARRRILERLGVILKIPISKKFSPSWFIFLGLFCACTTPQKSADKNFVHKNPDAVRQLRINEVSVAKNDWLELYNPTDQAIDLKGLTITDNPNDPGKANLSGTIESRGFLVLKASREELGFKLARTESLTLFDGGTVIDSITWYAGDAPEGRTFGKLPDGGEVAHRLIVPSPGEPNVKSDDVCGDNYATGDEVCDGEDVRRKLCTAYGFISGNLGCHQCQITAEKCEIEWRNVQVTEVTGTHFELVNLGNEPVDVSGWVLRPFGGEGAEAAIAADSKPLNSLEFRAFEMSDVTLPGDFVLADDIREIRDFLVIQTPTEALCRLPDNSPEFIDCKPSLNKINPPAYPSQK